MRRRPMQAWPRGQLNTGGSRALLALVVFALLAMLVPSSAAAASRAISWTVDGIAGSNGWWRGSSHGNLVVLALDRHRDKPLDRLKRVRPGDHDSGTDCRRNEDVHGDQRATALNVNPTSRSTPIRLRA